MSLPVDKALRKAMNYMRVGELIEAEELYKQVLSKFPKNKKAIQGYRKLKAGITSKGSSNSEPTQEQVQELINLYNQGQFEDALVKVKRLIGLFPGEMVLYNIKGASNTALSRYEAAVDTYKQALTISSEHVETYYNMGLALQCKGDLDAAIESYKQAVKIKPDYAKAHYNMGIAQKNKGDTDAAIKSYKQAIEIKPDYAEAFNNLGNALKDRGDLDTAIDSYKQAIRIKPDYAEAFNNLGNALKDRGDLDTAIDSYKQAIKIKPDYVDVYSNMGNALKAKGELDAAIDSYKYALQIKPDFAEVFLNMGNALSEHSELDAAIDSYKQAVKIKPDFAEAYNNMGMALKDIGNLQAAINSYKQALKIRPEYEIALAEKLHQQAHICDWSEIEQDREKIIKLGTSNQYIDPFVILSLEDNPERSRLRSELYVKSTLKQKSLALAPRPNKKPKRLRIGYFSADFHNHATMYLMAKVFELHDPEKFEIYAYSFGPDINDEMRQRLVNAISVFNNVKEMNNKDIALLARQDNLDIAVDLKGFTKNQRTGIFAYRAAPIQISYLGYPGTMGANFIDYIIADQVVIPAKHSSRYSESIIRLPYSYQVNDSERVISDRTITKIEMGLPEKGFIFCCFNQSYKISPCEFDIWMRLLGKVESSRLWLLKSNMWAEKNLKMEAEKRGISGNRLIFAEKKPQAEHLARHRLADLFVDTFNVNAHTTASDALWVGLPVVTKLGEGFAARVAGSLLTAIGIPELITYTLIEYEELALNLAANPNRLAEIKQKIAANRLSKPLFNTELFTKYLEDGYQRAYQQYSNGEKPSAINVPE